MAQLGRTAGSAAIFGADAFLLDHSREIAALALQFRIPAISVYRRFALEGGLMSYGPDVPAIFRRSASYLDRILKGASPADLPIQQPDKYELLINLKTAGAFGLIVPASLLAGADELIE